MKVQVWSTWPVAYDAQGRPDGGGWLEIHTCRQEENAPEHGGIRLDDPDLVAEIIRRGPEALQPAMPR